MARSCILGGTILGTGTGWGLLHGWAKSTKIWLNVKIKSKSGYMGILLLCNCKLCKAKDCKHVYFWPKLLILTLIFD